MKVACSLQECLIFKKTNLPYARWVAATLRPQEEIKMLSCDFSGLSSPKGAGCCRNQSFFFPSLEVTSDGVLEKPTRVALATKTANSVAQKRRHIYQNYFSCLQKFVPSMLASTRVRCTNLGGADYTAQKIHLHILTHKELFVNTSLRSPSCRDSRAQTSLLHRAEEVLPHEGMLRCQSQTSKNLYFIVSPTSTSPSLLASSHIYPCFNLPYFSATFESLSAARHTASNNSQMSALATAARETSTASITAARGTTGTLVGTAVLSGSAAEVAKTAAGGVTAIQSKLEYTPSAVPTNNSFCGVGTNNNTRFCALAGTEAFVNRGFEWLVGCWLLCCSGMIFALICWGGYTRLTRSGLSITDWRFQGRSLPRTEQAWDEEFRRYKDTPEYQQVHFDISLDRFKYIYFNEWFHRMLGRAIGFVFFGGLVSFFFGRALRPRFAFRLVGIGVLGGAQGFVGWWMVKSGFTEPKTEVKTPRVSPYRLTAHLSTAMILYSLTFWQALSLLAATPANRATAYEGFATTVNTAGPAAVAAAAKKVAVRTILTGFVIGITLLSGAFVAGNHAGHAYNTWPKMHCDWIPSEIYEIKNSWKKICESIPVVQFNHRMLAYSSAVASLFLYVSCRRLPLTPQLRKALTLVPTAVLTQVMLGITTLLLMVPTELGVIHQAGGMAVLTAIIRLLHTAVYVRSIAIF